MKDEFDAKMLGRVGSGQLTEAKSLKRTVHWHEQEMCFSWAGGTRYVTELAVLPGRTDTRAVTKTLAMLWSRWSPFRQPLSWTGPIAFLNLRTGSYFKIWFLNRRKKELITQTITCNLASVIDGRTRGSVYGSSVGYHVMGGVCSIDLQCCGVILPTCAQLGRGPECHELTFGAQGSSMCPGVIGSGMHSA